MNMTDWFEQKLLEHSFLNLPWSSPDTVEIALFTANPGEAGDTTNEVDASEYARQTVDFSSVFADPDSSGQVVENNFDIEFTQAEVDWGTITHAGVMTPGGDVMMYSQLTAFVEDETFTSNYDTAVNLDQDGIVEDSEEVTNTDGSGEFFEGRDYTMDYANGEITVLSTGEMADATDYNIDYEYSNEKPIGSGDLFRLPATQYQITFD